MTDEQPFLCGYRLLRIPVVDADGAPAWPDVFPLEKIDRLRAAAGQRHFSAQMMLEYISPERVRLDPDAIVFYEGEFNPRCACIESLEFRVESLDNEQSQLSTLNSKLSVTSYACYWDPSSARHGADASVVALVLRDDKLRRAFIHDIRYLRAGDDDLHPFATQCGAVLDFMSAHGLRHIAVEVNGLGNAMPEILRNGASARAQPLTVQKIINHQRKETRILDAIEPLLGTGRLYAHERVRATNLPAEMADWSPAPGAINRDDGLDAVAGALRLRPIPVRPLAAGARPINAKTEFII